MARKRSSQQKALLQGRLAETAPGPSSAHCPSARSRMASQQQHALGTIEGGISIDTHVRRKHQANTSVRRIHISRNQAPAPPQPTRTQPTRMARQLATTYSPSRPPKPPREHACASTPAAVSQSPLASPVQTLPDSARTAPPNWNLSDTRSSSCTKLSSVSYSPSSSSSTLAFQFPLQPAPFLPPLSSLPLLIASAPPPPPSYSHGPPSLPPPPPPPRPRPRPPTLGTRPYRGTTAAPPRSEGVRGQNHSSVC